MTVNTNEPAGALVIREAAIRTEVLLADLAPAAVLPGKNPPTRTLEFMDLRGINLVAVSIGFFESLGYHFGHLYQLSILLDSRVFSGIFELYSDLSAVHEKNREKSRYRDKLSV